MQNNDWTLSASLATLVFLTGVASAQPQLPKPPGIGPGEFKIETIQAYSGTRLMKPAGIVVYDFDAPGCRTESFDFESGSDAGGTDPAR
jgi:hypothetical protein